MTSRGDTISIDQEIDRLLASDPHALAEAPEVWRRLRQRSPTHWHGPTLFLTRYADVKPLLAAPVGLFGKGGVDSTQAQQELMALGDDDQAVFRELIAFESLFMSRTTDESAHDRLRRIAHRAFTPRRIAAIRPTVERHTQDLVSALWRDAKRDDGVADLCQFSNRLPLAVMGGLLGLPEEDHEQLYLWSRKMAMSGSRTPGALRDGLEAVQEFRAYAHGLVARHRRDPASVSDLIGAMLDAESSERLSPEELAAMIVNLLFAGHETTTNLLAIGLLELLRQREQWALLAAEPGRSAAATEELLRFVSPTQLMPRVASQPLQAGGEQIEPHQSIQLVLSAANRDPEVFEVPESLNIARQDAKAHVALGFGPRFCLGASLLRLEGEVGFRALAEAFPRMRLVSDDAEWSGPAMLRSPRNVLVGLES
jgi:cytochrome P450